MRTGAEKDLTLRHLLGIFDRRRRLLVWSTAICFVLAVLACLLTTRRYEASSTIQLQNTPADRLGLDNMISATGSEGGGSSDAMTLNVDLQTQMNVLQSDSLALKVIKDLNLEQNADFKPHFNPLDWALGLFSPGGVPDPPNASLEDSPGRRRQLLAVFDKRLKVKVTSGTRLIDVKFVNRDPKVAAAVVNHLVQALIDFTFQTSLQATNQVSEGLQGQLADLRKHSEELQSKVVALQQTSGLFGLGGTDAQGKPEVSSPVLQNLDRSTAQLSQATMNRVIKEAVYNVVKSGKPEAISQLSGTNMSSEGGQGVMNSLNLIQSLQAQEASLSSEIEKESAKFGPAYPHLQQEKASLKQVQKSEEEEINRIAVRAKSDYDIAVQAEQGAQAAYKADRAAAERLNNQSVEYAILSKEADQSQQLYQDLLKRLKEGGILQGLHGSNITVVDPARAPAKPATPQVPLYLIGGIGIGLLLGAIAALMVDATDDKIQGIEQIESLSVPFLGILPQFKREVSTSESMLLQDQSSPFNEAVRTIRSTLLISRSGKAPQVILIASGSPEEGKTLIALSLATSLAQTGKRVLLIEGDMRRPTMSKLLGLNGSGGTGLSGLLSNGESTMTTVPLGDNPNLHILPAGAKPLYPAELLSSHRFESLLEEWKREFDFVVIDSPPVLPVADSQLLEGLADATILVARDGVTSRIALERTYKSLHQHAKDPDAPMIGIVLNGVSPGSPTYHDYYGYRSGVKYQYTDTQA